MRKHTQRRVNLKRKITVTSARNYAAIFNYTKVFASFDNVSYIYLAIESSAASNRKLPHRWKRERAGQICQELFVAKL